MESFSVIIPVFNEEETIYHELKRLEKLKSERENCEIILVNDGSTDNTSNILNNYNFPKGIKLINHHQNRGYGASLKTGIAASLYDIVVIIDADGTYPTEKILELVEELKDADMVVGARVGSKAKIPLIRRPAKWVMNKLANYLSEQKIPDLNSGLRAMRKKVVTKFLKILPDNFSFTVTITLAMLTNGYNVKYAPINYFKRTGKSKIKPIRNTLYFIQLIIRTVLYFRPLKVFIPVSLILFLSSFGVLFYSYFFTTKVMDVTTVVLFIGAVQTLAIGMIADLIDKRMN